MTDEQYRELLEMERDKVYAYPNWEETVLRIQSHYGGEDYLRSRGFSSKK